MGELLSAAAGSEITFHLQMKLDGKTSTEVIENINEVLAEINETLQFRKV